MDMVDNHRICFTLNIQTMKNTIIIGAILLAAWYFFFKKKAVSSPGAQAINPTPTAKEVIQKVNDFLIAPEPSLVNPAQQIVENIKNLVEQPTPVFTELSLEKKPVLDDASAIAKFQDSQEKLLAPYLSQRGTSQYGPDHVPDIENGEKWNVGAYGPFGRELTPGEKTYIRNRFIPIAKLIYGPVASRDAIAILNSDQYSVYIYDVIRILEGYVAQNQQITDNASWQANMTNKNMYFEDNGDRDMTKTPVVPEILRNYKPFINPETAQPF